MSYRARYTNREAVDLLRRFARFVRDTGVDLSQRDNRGIERAIRQFAAHLREHPGAYALPRARRRYTQLKNKRTSKKRGSKRRTSRR